MNATVFAVNVNKLVNKFGNDMEYFAPNNSTGYNNEGDWEPTHAATTVVSHWVEPDKVDNREHTELGIYPLHENEGILRNDVSPLVRGKIVSNGITWEIVDLKPTRVRDTMVYNVVVCKKLMTAA